MTAAEDKSPDQEPSMDDILASIRRIMLDEQARLRETGEGSAAASPPFVLPDVPVDSAAASGAVLVLDETMAVADATEPVVPLTLDATEIAATTLPLAALVPTAEADAEPAIDHALPVTLDSVTTGESTVAGGLVAPGVITGMTVEAMEAIIAPAAAAAATASVEALMRRLQAERDALLQPASASTPISMEDFVRAELRPLLKSWLDENLPTLVERLVRAELARLTLRHGV